ncbi:hypothetical protein J7413_03015 [Shimia sp. R10_1]|uniref:hypothetical protein n=1 Tax=Shimia sp. R10_1 TaxID=2821095 RepID=UPI001ADAC8F4|nr:hypothetical protein [Shimia sp. R10_1]MBO9472499.1 hypothetical protein [Shimia sp. R10_1]
MSLRRRILYAILGLTLALSLVPAGLVYWAHATAQKHGCAFGMAMHENGCWVAGENIASQLNAAYAKAALMIVSLPIGFVAMLALIGMIAVDLRRRAAQQD